MTTHPRPRPRSGWAGSDLDDLLTGWLLGAVALVGAGGLLLWAAGQLAGLLAHGRWPDAPLTAGFGIAVRWPAHVADPAAAWPAAARDQIPGPVLLYPVLVALVVAGIATSLLAVSAWGQHRAARPQRERDRSPLWARPAQIRPLLVPRAVPGRVVLGRIGPRGGCLVAAEPRRSVLVVAPTQAGKTSRIVVPTVLRWTGPMLVTSVKADVLRLTLTERLRRGPAHVFDPTGALTGGDGAASGGGIDAAVRGAAVKWSPLLGCATYPGAERTAAWLVEAGGDPRGETATFWESLAAKMLSPLLYAAAGTGRSVRHVAAWIDRRETTEISEALGGLGDVDALDAWAATCAREERQRDSVYATAETILRAFASPSARAATDITGDDHAAGRVLDVERLLAHSGTLYLVAPAHEQGRLRPLFESLVQSVLRAAQDTYARTGRPLDPALMVMLDEAANIAPLRQLATHAATGAGQGIQICSVWQDLAQVEALYGRRAATVVNGHTARVFLAGSADLATLDATSRMIGDHPTRRASISTNPDGGRSVSEHSADARLAPVEYLRQLPADAAVVLYGSAPPIRLTTIPWYVDPHLRRLVGPEAAAESDQSGGTHRGAGWPRRRPTGAGERRCPKPLARPQMPTPPVSPTFEPGLFIATHDAVPLSLPSDATDSDFDPWSTEMTLSNMRDLTQRLVAAASPQQEVAVQEALASAWQAAHLAEAVVLGLVRRGSAEDVPAYLTAADAFATVRTDLDELVDSPEPISDLDAGAAPELGGDPAEVENALADLARTLILFLSRFARTCGDPELALAASRAALSAADAAEATTRARTP